MTLLVVPFDLVDRRGLGPAEAGLLFLPFTLGVALLSRCFGTLADRTGPRVLLMVGPLLAAAAYLWMALARNAGIVIGVAAPMLLLGVGFAVLVAPLTASVLSCLGEDDEGLASGVNNAVSRIAQLAGVALAAGLASFTFGFQATLALAASASIAAVAVIAAFLPPPAKPA
jgi:predicted MFS family arabinose efflux permease